MQLKKNREKITQGAKLIPTFSVGWNPSPRIDRPTPWMRKSDGSSAYANVCYAPRASCDELYAGAKEFVSFIKSEARNSFIGHILTFAWNEFEEGGYFCPTYTSDGKVDTARVDVFAKIAKMFHSELIEI